MLWGHWWGPGTAAGMHAGSRAPTCSGIGVVPIVAGPVAAIATFCVVDLLEERLGGAADVFSGKRVRNFGCVLSGLDPPGGFRARQRVVRFAGDKMVRVRGAHRALGDP